MEITYEKDNYGEHVLIIMNYQPSGGKTWLAEITGLDTKYGIKRDFLRESDIRRSSSRKTGTNYYFLRKDGYYEYNEAWKDRGFFRIIDGKYENVTRDDIIMSFKQIEA